MSDSNTGEAYIFKKDILLAKTCIDGNLCNVFSDGEGGKYTVILEENASVCSISNVSIQSSVTDITPEYRDAIFSIPTEPRNRENELDMLRNIAKQRRDALLSKTDWTQLFDVPQATIDKWQPYRQALRDITLQEGFPENITWPTPP
jgi:hypothetical protein